MLNRRNCQLCVLLIVAVFVGTASSSVGSAEPPPAPRDSAKGELHTVTARVIYGSDGGGYLPPAALDPVEFEVPEGYQAANFFYHWADPKTGETRDKIGAKNVYSISQGRYMSEVKDNPKATLPAGRYRFIVGGLPGAMGNLTYSIVKASATEKTGDKPHPGERVIDVVVWSPAPKSDYNPKQKATYRITNGKVLGEIDQVLEPPQYGKGVTCDPLPITGKFVGTISGNVIEGKWETKIAAHRMHFSGINGPDYDRVDKFSQTFESRLVLYADGTLSETMKGTGVTEWEWGPTAPAGAPGESKKSSHHSEFSVPGEYFLQPMQGTWKERR